jgi:hypothetical protein
MSSSFLAGQIPACVADGSDNFGPSTLYTIDDIGYPFIQAPDTDGAFGFSNGIPTVLGGFSVVNGNTTLDDGAIFTDGYGDLTTQGLIVSNNIGNGNLQVSGYVIDADNMISIDPNNRQLITNNGVEYVAVIDWSGNNPDAAYLSFDTAGNATFSGNSTTNDNLYVGGSSQLDNGTISTDGDGNFTAASLNASNGFSGTGIYTHFTVVNGIITSAS